MTTGPDNLGNGVAKTDDRFAGQLGYRPRVNREGGSAQPSGPLNGGQRGASPLATSPLAVGGPLDGVGDEFGSRGPGIERITSPLDIANPIASTLTQPKLDESGLREPALADLGYHNGGYRDGGLSGDSWLDGPGRSVADHPLLRGLLLELPAKGASLQAQWLDRWFEAARSILELLYRFEDKRD